MDIFFRNTNSYTLIFLLYFQVVVIQQLIIDTMRKFSIKVDGSYIIDSLLKLDVSLKGMLPFDSINFRNKIGMRNDFNHHLLSFLSIMELNEARKHVVAIPVQIAKGFIHLSFGS